MNVRILRNECCGNAECVALAPNVFVLDSKNKAVVVSAESATRALLIEVAEACPCQAIVLEDDDGKQVHP